MKTKAAVLRDGSSPFVLEELEVGDPGTGEVLVRMVATGMCHSDLVSRELPPEYFGGPSVFGHEGAGIIEALGPDVDSFTVGDHVVMSFNSCKTCPACTIRRPASCFDFGRRNSSGGRLDGTSAFTDSNGNRVASHFFGQSSFAEHSVVAQNSLVKVDAALDLTKLGPLGCGIQTGAGAVFNTLDVQPGSSLVVAGVGALGMAAVMAAKVAGAGTIIAIDRHPSRLDLAQRYGATHTITGDPKDFTATITGITGGGADYVFDATGSPVIVKALYEGMTNIGVLAMAGISFGEMTFSYLSMISSRVVKGVILGDSIPQEFVPRLAQLNAEGVFPYDDLIETFSIDEINDAEAGSLSGEVIKPVLLFDA